MAWSADSGDISLVEREPGINIINIGSIYNKLQRENTEHLTAEKLLQVGWINSGNIDKLLEEILLIEYKM